jgi:hypothetical protein
MNRQPAWIIVGVIFFIVSLACLCRSTPSIETKSQSTPILHNTLTPQRSIVVTNTPDLQITLNAQNTPIANGTSYKLYESDQYSFELPRDARLGKGSHGSGFKWKTLFSAQAGLVWVYVFEPVYSSGQGLAEVYRQAYSDFVKLDTLTRIESETDTTLDTLNAKQIIYQYPWGEPWYKQIDRWVERDGKILIASCVYYPNLKDVKTAEQECLHYFSTFHFN